MTSRRLTSGGPTYTQTWDYDNKLASATISGATTTFTYDGNGTLVKKVAGGQTTVYVGPHYEKNVTTGQVTSYYFFGAQRVAMNKGGVLYFVAGDHLGTTSVVINASGTLHSEVRHYPYGDQRWSNGTLPTDYRFTDQRFEPQLGGLYHMGARFYDSYLARWLSPDSIVPDPKSPQSLNRYSYVAGNVLKFTDPTGHKEEGECGFNGESCTQAPPDYLTELLLDPEFQAWLATQIDNWLWENIPSAFGVKIGGYLEADILAGSLVSSDASVIFNWRSGEIGVFATPSAAFRLGTPDLVSAGGYAGLVGVYGASDNSTLVGPSATVGGGVQIDAITKAGLNYSNSRAFVWDNGNPVVDPRSGNEVWSEALTASLGGNVFACGVDAQITGGFDYTFMLDNMSLTNFLIAVPWRVTPVQMNND